MIFVKRHAGIFAVCAVFFALGILRLNDLSLYTPDSCRYVIWGNSLAHGNGFVDDTQPDPDRFVVNAPFYAVLIAPVEILFPLSLIAVKAWTLLWGVLALILFHRWIRPLLGESTALVATIILAMNPAMVLLSTEALSEAPFMVIILAVLLLTGRLASQEGNRRKHFALLVVCVSCIGLLREAGVAMVVAAFVFFYSRRQKGKSLVVLVSSGVLLGLWFLRNQHWAGTAGESPASNVSVLLQHFVTPPDSPLMNEIALRMWISFKSYIFQIGGMILFPLSTDQFSILMIDQSNAYRFLNSLISRLNPVILLLLVSVVFTGIVRDLRNSPTAILRIVFGASYLVIIFSYPVHDLRFLVPLLPLMLYYVAYGTGWVARRIEEKWSVRTTRVRMIGMILLTVPNLFGLFHLLKTNVEYQRSPESVLRYASVPRDYKYRWNRVGGWIRGNVPGDAVIASPVKDLVLVASGRKVLELSSTVMLPQFEERLRGDHVKYLFAPSWWRDLRAYEFLMRESRRFWFEPVAEIPSLMKVHSRILDPPFNSHAHEEFDTLSPGDLLRMGRKDLAEGDYGQAARTMIRSLRLAPGEPEVLFQAMVAALMAGDTVTARTQYRKLLTLPQTLSYVDQAVNHWNAVGFLNRAATGNMPEERAVNSFQAAMIYWKIGYPRRAADIMNGLFEADSSYFAGLLWGFYFDMQVGDTSRALAFLSRLERMDSSNNVVKSFRRIVSLNDSLRLVSSAGEKSALHLKAGSVYKQIDLDDEAIDEAEKALKENPKNTDALLFLAQLFEKRNHARQAEEYYREILRYDPQNSVATERLEVLQETMTLR